MDTSKLTNEDLYFDFSLLDNIKKFEKIYNIIYNKAKNGESLTEIEKEFLCRRLKFIDIDKLPFDSNVICKNHRFKFIYLVYMWDLSGGSVYTKPFKLKMVTVPIPEAQEDLKYLMDQADNWENILNDPNLTDQLLIQSKREVDIALKGIKNDPFYITGGYLKKKHMIRATYLRSKFIYLLAKEVFESFNKQDFVLDLDGKRIIINEFSIIHTVSRHYAEVMTQCKTGKSYHNANFNPRLLNTELKTIFDKINNSGGLNQALINNINFIYKGTTYRIYTTDNNTNNSPILLSTFFPVEDTKLVRGLIATHDLIYVDDELSFYRAK